MGDFTALRLGVFLGTVESDVRQTANTTQQEEAKENNQGNLRLDLVGGGIALARDLRQLDNYQRRREKEKKKEHTMKLGMLTVGEDEINRRNEQNENEGWQRGRG